MYSLGFSTAALGSFFVLHIAGSFIALWLNQTTRELLLIVIMMSLTVAEVVRSGSGKPFAIGPHRQTPQSLGRRPVGILLWGIDTGIPITTIRITPLPLAGILMVLLGYGKWWIGLSYVAGFIGSLMLATTWPPKDNPRVGIPLDVTLTLSKQASRVKFAGVVAVALITTITVGVTVNVW